MADESPLEKLAHSQQPLANQWIRDRIDAYNRVRFPDLIAPLPLFRPGGYPPEIILGTQGPSVDTALVCVLREDVAAALAIMSPEDRQLVTEAQASTRVADKLLALEVIVRYIE